MKHTKIYQARIQRTFITTTFHVFLGLSEHGKFQGLRKYATNDHTSTKNYKNPAALIKDSILWIKTTTKNHKNWNSTNIDDITFCGLTQQQNPLKLKINEYR